jgi:hypothetical protein
MQKVTENEFFAVYEFYFFEKCDHRRFGRAFGFHVETLTYAYNKTEFWNCGPIEEFCYFFAFVKNDNNLLHNNFRVGETLFYRKVWKTLAWLNETLEEVKQFSINFQVKILNCVDQEEFDAFPNALCIIDTIPFEVPRFTNFRMSKINYSVHSGMYCWKYQIIVNRSNGVACSVLGPYNGSISDETILIKSQIIDLFPRNVQFFADKIYFGPYLKSLERVFIPYRGNLTTEEIKFNKSFGNARVIVENWNQRLKNYNSIFEKPWRHNEDRHCQTINVLSNLINIELNHGHPLRKNE